MTGQTFTRLYHKIVGKELVALGFCRAGGGYLRVRDRLVHAILLHKSSPWDFTGEFAILPLVNPRDGVSITFGDRVDEMDPGRTQWWKVPEDSQALEGVLREYAGVLVDRVMPWLDRFQSCRDIVETDLAKRWGVWLLDTPTKSKQAIDLGLCALAADMPVEAQRYLEFAQAEYRRYLRPEGPEWFRDDLRLLEEYLALLARGDWPGIKAKLAEGEASTRRSIGLPPASG